MCQLKECPTSVEFRALSVLSTWLDRGNRALARGKVRRIEAPKWHLRKLNPRPARMCAESCRLLLSVAPHKPLRPRARMAAAPAGSRIGTARSRRARRSSPGPRLDVHAPTVLGAAFREAIGPHQEVRSWVGAPFPGDAPAQPSPHAVDRDQRAGGVAQRENKPIPERDVKEPRSR